MTIISLIDPVYYVSIEYFTAISIRQALNLSKFINLFNSSNSVSFSVNNLFIDSINIKIFIKITEE
jgi:hypothetical protein